jgi:hypothetical protein
MILIQDVNMKTLLSSMCAEVLEYIATRRCITKIGICFKLQFPVSIFFKVVHQSMQNASRITNRNQKKMNSMHIIPTVP